MNNSRRVGYMRTDELVRAIRDSDISAAITRKIGLKYCDAEESRKLPLVKLSSMLSRATAEENESEGR